MRSRFYYEKKKTIVKKYIFDQFNYSKENMKLRCWWCHKIFEFLCNISFLSRNVNENWGQLLSELWTSWLREMVKQPSLSPGRVLFKIIFPIFSKNIAFSRKNCKMKKYSKPHSHKKGYIHFRHQTPPSHQKRLGP